MIAFQQHRLRAPRFCARAMLLLSTLLAAAAHAQTLYQVELIVFARDGADEHWHSDYQLSYPEHLTALQDGTGEGAALPFQRLAANALQLKREAAAISQRRNMRVLFHGAWQQPFDDQARATSVLITGGQNVGNHRELEGFVTLSSERYLHIDTQLWMSRFAANNGMAVDNALTLPPLPFSPDNAQDTHGAAVSQIYVLRDQQRLRSGELRYQDHPRLGTLVLITPVTPAPAQAPQP